MIVVEREFESGYIRPIGRGIVLQELSTSLGIGLEDLIDEEVRKAIGSQTISTGIDLKGIKVKIEIKEARIK